MRRKADEVLHYDGQNPFSDSQARGFSDSKIISEFYPTSSFWSLFNDQHEVLLGTRGSGKTYLLKMMRRSMLKRINDPKANKIIQDKEFLALYVPMHLEVISEFNRLQFSPERLVTLFQFFFNCILAEAIVLEVADITEEEKDEVKCMQTTVALLQGLDHAWFGNDITYGRASNFKQLIQKIRTLFYSFDLISGDIGSIPPVFKRQICASLIAVKALIADVLEFDEEPTWIVCIDEAEFLNEKLQKCINNLFRADSNRIALKVATLPYYHSTLGTLDTEISVSMGNDFNYRIVDLKPDSEDFKKLTDQLCAHRLKTRLTSMQVNVETLEDFLGRVGNDDLIDYYRTEVGAENASREIIEQKMIENFSIDRREGSKAYSNTRKTIYDKFSTVFFVREMYILSGKGNSKPGWYAGATTVRKVSQGNPRMFIQIMNSLFEKARKTQLTPKAQHEVILKFSADFCKATQGVNYQAHNRLDAISSYIKEKVHRKDKMVTIGCAFWLSYVNQLDFEYNLDWLRESIAYSRLVVPDDALINGLEQNTKYMLANAYAAYYWIPMRSDSASKISIKALSENRYFDNKAPTQMCFFEEVT